MKGVYNPAFSAAELRRVTMIQSGLFHPVVSVGNQICPARSCKAVGGEIYYAAFFIGARAD